MSQMDTEKNKRELIKKIKDDPNLSNEQKNLQIQKVMMGNHNMPKIVSNQSKTCSHYDKQCYKFYFDCCDIYDPCKRCHLERNCCASSDIKISSITCSNCETSQEPGSNCSKCEIRFAQSYCDKCQIWTGKQIYHCEDCGICRVGTKETLYHCARCKICFNKSNDFEHNCVRNNNILNNDKSIESIKSTELGYKEEVCVVCFERTFDSQSEPTFLKCGHLIHANCFAEYLKHHNYKCPYCKKSIGDLEFHWDIIRNQIKLHPLPNDFFPIYTGDIIDSDYGKFKVNSISFVEGKPMYTGEFAYDFFVTPNTKYYKKNIVMATLNANVVRKNYYKQIHCNDCGKKSTTPFHFYGLECKECGSFNTQE